MVGAVQKIYNNFSEFIKRKINNLNEAFMLYFTIDCGFFELYQDYIKKSIDA
jgi:hypothetical protein